MLLLSKTILPTYLSGIITHVFKCHHRGTFLMTFILVSFICCYQFKLSSRCSLLDQHRTFSFAPVKDVISSHFASLNCCISVIIRYAQPIPCFMNHSVFRISARIQKSRHTKNLGASAFHLPKINLVQHLLTADLIKPQVS